MTEEKSTSQPRKSFFNFGRDTKSRKAMPINSVERQVEEDLRKMEKEDPAMWQTLKSMAKEAKVSEKELLLNQHAYFFQNNWPIKKEALLNKALLKAEQADIRRINKQINKQIKKETKEILAEEIKNKKGPLKKYRFINEQKKELDYWKKVKADKEAKEAKKDAGADRNREEDIFPSGYRYA